MASSVAKYVLAKNGARRLSASEWLAQAADFLPAEEAEALRAKAAGRLRSQHEEAVRRARELEGELAKIGVTSDADSQPSADWPIAKLILHYVERHPGSLATEIVAFVLSVRPGDKRQMEANVHSVLYKFSKDGGYEKLTKGGVKGKYRFALRTDKKVTP